MICGQNQYYGRSDGFAKINGFSLRLLFIDIHCIADWWWIETESLALIIINTVLVPAKPENDIKIKKYYSILSEIAARATDSKVVISCVLYSTESEPEDKDCSWNRDNSTTFVSVRIEVCLTLRCSVGEFEEVCSTGFLDGHKRNKSFKYLYNTPLFTKQRN